MPSMAPSRTRSEPSPTLSTCETHNQPHGVQIYWMKVGLWLHSLMYELVFVKRKIHEKHLLALIITVAVIIAIAVFVCLDCTKKRELLWAFSLQIFERQYVERRHPRHLGRLHEFDRFISMMICWKCIVVTMLSIGEQPIETLSQSIAVFFFWCYHLHYKNGISAIRFRQSDFQEGGELKIQVVEMLCMLYVVNSEFDT